MPLRSAVRARRHLIGENVPDHALGPRPPAIAWSALGLQLSPLESGVSAWISPTPCTITPWFRTQDSESITFRQVHIWAIEGIRSGILEKVVPAFSGIEEEANAAAEAEYDRLGSIPADPNGWFDMSDAADLATEHGSARATPQRESHYL